jgi:hypothetical protein
MKIVITVPHYKCPKNYYPKDHTYHPCDWVAAPVAKALKQKLEAKGYEVVIIFGNKLRKTEVDLNRPEGRPTKFHDKMHTELENADLLIDCHSFPKDSEKYQEWELVIFQSPYDNLNTAFLLYKILKNLGLCVAFKHAFTRDCILNDAAKNRHVSVLIEHNEDLDIDMLTDFEAEAIDEFMTKVRSKMGIVLQVVKETVPMKKMKDVEEKWLLEETTKKLGQ